MDGGKFKRCVSFDVRELVERCLILRCNVVLWTLCSAGKKYINNYDNIFGNKKKETQENGGETGNESL